jgi:DNA phosphorothioation-associated putative methyltransferase
MEFAEYAACLKQIPFGKRLPTALYVFRADGFKFPSALDSLLASLTSKYAVTVAFNVIKFRTDELKLSFLSYPDFLSQAHPALRHAITIDLVTGKARHTDYARNINPPILHRKESFLPPDHPNRAEFQALTRAEEAGGVHAVMQNAAHIYDLFRVARGRLAEINETERPGDKTKARLVARVAYFRGG